MFSREKYWSALPCPPLGDLPDPGIESPSLMSLAQESSLPLAPLGKSNDLIFYLTISIRNLSPNVAFGEAGIRTLAYTLGGGGGAQFKP